MKNIRSLLLSLVLPTGILIVALLTYLNLHSLSPTLWIILPYAPYGIFLLGMGLALWFNRSRIFFALLIFEILFATFSYVISTDSSIFLTNTLLTVTGLLLPLNLLLFSILKERGFLTLWGILRFLWIGAQLALVSWIILAPKASIIDFLSIELFPVPWSWPMGQSAFITVLLTLGLFIVKLLYKPAYSDPYFIICLILGLIPMYLWVPAAFWIFFTAAGLTLILAIIQDSYRMSYMDELTGLPGRRALKEELLKLSGTYTITMVDIDFFKKFNDKHGHDVGDEVLKMVAACLRQVTGGGKAFRYGGEEFTILFPGKELKDTLSHLEELRERVAKRPFILRAKNRPRKKPATVKRKAAPGKRLFVTISLGVAGKGTSAKTPQEVLKNADKALYRAKKKGRNCVSK